MLARLSAFVIWSLVAGTAMFWALRFAASPLQAPSYAVPVERSAPARGDLARLFGAAPTLAEANQARPEATSRFRLLGVMAPKSSSAEDPAGYGLALIAVDGKPAKAFIVGAALESGLVLQSVGLRTASLGPAQGERSVLLELPALPAPATGTLPPVGVGTNGAAAAARVVPIAPRLSPAAVLQPAAPIVGMPQPPSMQSQPVPASGEAPVPNPNLPQPDEARSQ